MARKVEKGPRPKHVPQRMCVACRQGGAKRELVRIVRTPAGKVQVDLIGKVSGRGAYLCRSRACWELAARKKMIEHVFQTTLALEERAGLEQFAAGLPG